MKTRGIITTLIIVIVLAGLVYYKVKSSKEAAVNSAVPKKGPSYVTTFVVKTHELDNTIQSAGTLLANEEVEIRPEISGKITKIYFKEGSPVTKGELLVKIYDADLQAQLQKLKFQEKLSAETEARQKKLLTINGISQQDYDVVLNQLNSNRADIDLISTQIAKTEIRAPFDGVIGLKTVSEGSYVSPTNIIASMQEIDPLKIDFSIPEKYMLSVKKGDPIHFTVPGSPKTYEGAIYAIEPKIDMNTRSVLLRAMCPNKTKEILPGAFASVELQMQKIDNAILIPTESVIPKLKILLVFLYKNGKAQPRVITTGIRNDSAIQVTSGLNAGDTVITTGIMQLKEGSPVKIMHAN